ncbi:MAG TPA: 4-(cytidine 5'-diphospho)-2-C-methyl-D-erythritol kinase, partial [Candidatus Limiplasma sp.]|nr:4-(cytidine 5'-diphospho)-2-C-methyl-D-erythritol kinase [Candidatus Limiplasma sp.]
MLRLLARAKINWTLDILGRREDGYHWMDMLMESVDLGDELCLIPAQQELQLTVTGAEGLAMPDNLVLKAARALQAETGCRSGATFLLTKRAPVGAGMGGGSADAAAALVGLNRLWETNLSPKRLAELGLSVGADVPFLLLGGLARVGGIGETLQPLTAARPVPLVAVQPCQALSTREVFTAFDALPRVNHPQTDTAQAALIRRDFAALSGLAGNVLAQASEAKRPQIAEAIAALEAFGAAFATMTGSGSAVFGAFETERE